MHRRDETEIRHRRRRLDLVPVSAVVDATPDAVVMLAPQLVRLARATHDAMGILDRLRTGQLGRHVGGEHALGAQRPAGAAVRGQPGAAAGHPHQHRIAVARIDADAVDARHIVAAAHPLRALRHVPKRVDQLPAVAAIVRAEQAARQGAGPQHARLIGSARRQAPDHAHRPFDRIGAVQRFGGKGRRRHFHPSAGARVAPMQLGAEVAEVERRVQGAVTPVRQHHRHRIAKKVLLIEQPRFMRAIDFKQSFASRDISAVGHVSLLKELARYRLWNLAPACRPAACVRGCAGRR